MIICIKCNEDKDLDNFDTHKMGRYGRRTICKLCQAKYAKNYRLKNTKFIKELKTKHRNTFDGFIINSLGGARRRAKKHNREFNISKEFIMKLWSDQKGLCAFSGHPLEYLKAAKIKNPYQGSLDRIDSSIGYTKENVRWVCWFINVMKLDYSDNQFRHLIQLANSK